MSRVPGPAVDLVAFFERFPVIFDPRHSIFCEGTLDAIIGSLTNDCLELMIAHRSDQLPQFRNLLENFRWFLLNCLLAFLRKW
jgi:hypothetical protein